ncbi:MAG: hypothetical protein NFCOHLIN_02849 [Gammaproteobacteria bacterium]|nr:hypothetical protein [Gammaproteobacteria bacterium]
MDIRNTIRHYVLENFLFTDDESTLRDDDSFLARGIIDSVGALEIAAFLEERFGITVKDDELLPDNLDSVGNLVAYIERKQPQLA